MATEALIAHVVISSFVIRCRSIVRRRCSSAKASRWTVRRSAPGWGAACWWLDPLYELVVGTVLSTDKVFADGPTLPVLEPAGGPTGRLWCYAVDDRPWTGPTTPAEPYVAPKTAG